MKKRGNKKAQELSIGTLVLIVLGIIVLVLIVLGFTMGWGKLWEKFNIFGGATSIGDVIQACQLHVTQSDKYRYCQEFKKIKVNTETEYVNCQDNRVATSLTQTLDCGNEDYKAAQCNKLSENEKSKVKVNGELCTANGITTSNN